VTPAARAAGSARTPDERALLRGLAWGLPPCLAFWAALLWVAWCLLS